MKTKSIKNLVKAAACTATLLLAAACSNELPQEGDALDNDTPITLTATLASNGGTDTRISFGADNNGTVKLSWTEGDAFTLRTGPNKLNFSKHAGTFTLISTTEGNAQQGNFSGNLSEEGSFYKAFYPAASFPDSPNAGSGISIIGQVQIGNDSKDHLPAFNFMESKIMTTLADGITFTPILTLLIFDLTMPEGITTATELKMVASGGENNNVFGKTLYENAPTLSKLSLELQGITIDNDNKLKAYMLVQSFFLENQDLSIIVSTNLGDYTYQKKNITGNHVEGGSYTATVKADQWVAPKVETDEMKFTVTVEEGNLKFSIPFPTSGNVPANITVQWEQGSEVITIKKDEELKSDDKFDYTYNSAGTYQITITSDAKADEQQIPKFNFGTNRYGNGNCAKLVSLDTPLLNMNISKLPNCFQSCSSLTTIPEGLFEKNVSATDFSNCFQRCSSLTTIPEGLFKGNMEAKYFSYCFDQCAALTTVPERLFAENEKALDFDYCFRSCRKLEEVQAGLFENNVDARDFSYCFNSCSALASIPTGLFDNNTKVMNFSFCFNSCYALASVPEGLFAENEKATDFTNCFYNCSHLVLNEYIFVTADDTDARNRFVDKPMKFGGCFGQAGTSAVTPGPAPELWDYEWGTGEWEKKQCFQNCKMSNAANLSEENKSDWGYPSTPSPSPSPADL